MKWASFEEWFRAVDAAVGRKCMLSVEDLPDCCYDDWYESGMTPREAAREAICNAGGEDLY